MIRRRYRHGTVKAALIARMHAAIDATLPQSAGPRTQTPHQKDPWMKHNTPSLTDMLRDIARALADPTPAQHSGITEAMDDLGVVLRNLDGWLDHDVAAQLVAREGEAYGTHAAWDFCGKVWYANGRWHEEVMVYRQSRGVWSHPTLEGLRDVVCAEFGDD